MDDDCNTGVCDPGTGQCKANPKKDGTACNDGDKCTLNDQCTAGKCAGTTNTCDDNNACTIDTCDSATGGCIHTNTKNGTSCDDGNACTLDDQCTDGQCGGTPKDCDDGNACTTDSCNNDTGECVHENVADGTACEDGLACTVNDSCTNGECKGGQEKDCSSLDDQCNTGVCDESARGCIAQPRKDGTTCDDGNKCTINDQCKKGSCQGESRTCDDGNACTLGQCDPETGKCVYSTLPDGTKCGDCMICSTGKCIQDTTCVSNNGGNGGGGCTYSAFNRGGNSLLFLMILAGLALLLWRKRRTDQ